MLPSFSGLEWGYDAEVLRRGGHERRGVGGQPEPIGIGNRK
jgi:hypothetical protein